MKGKSSDFNRRKAPVPTARFTQVAAPGLRDLNAICTYSGKTATPPHTSAHHYKTTACGNRGLFARRGKVWKGVRVSPFLGHFTAACFCLALLASLPALADTIELVIAEGGPFPADITQQAIQDAAAALSAATGHDIRVVGHFNERAATKRCLVGWYSGFGVELGIVARAYSKNFCQVMFRVGLEGISSPRQLTCAAMHEIGHVLIGNGWHSEDPDSVMYESESARGVSPCEITQDFLEHVHATDNAALSLN